MGIIVHNVFVLGEWFLYIVVSLVFKTFHVIILTIYKFKFFLKTFHVGLLKNIISFTNLLVLLHCFFFVIDIIVYDTYKH